MLSGEDVSTKFLSMEQHEDYSSEINVEEEPKKAGCPSGQREKIFSQLSRITCAVLDKAVKVLSTTLEKLQHDFKRTHQGPAKQSVEAARSFLEYCCFKALALLTQQNNFLHDAENRHFTFNFMVAWETPLGTDEDKAAVKVAVVFLTLALVLVIAPVKYVVSALHLGLFAFTLRDKTTENRLVRRLRELWHTIPPISVRMIESDGLKTQKG